MQISSVVASRPLYRPAVSAAAAPTSAPGEVSLSEKLINEMIRGDADPQARAAIAESLSFMPLEALARVSQYGTRIEVYDRNAADLPLYARHLQKPNLAGAYSPTANVIFFDRHNITPLVLLHEFSHALDRSLGDVSERDDWKRATQKSLESRACIRPYATRNSAEYFADNLAAHLIPDDKLPALLRNDWQKGTATAGLTQEYFVQNHVNYSHGRQLKADPTAYAKMALLLENLPTLAAADARPALTPEQYKAEKIAELREMKARQEAQG